MNILKRLFNCNCFKKKETPEEKMNKSKEYIIEKIEEKVEELYTIKEEEEQEKQEEEDEQYKEDKLYNIILEKNNETSWSTPHSPPAPTRVRRPAGRFPVLYSSCTGPSAAKRVHDDSLNKKEYLNDIKKNRKEYDNDEISEFSEWP